MTISKQLEFPLKIADATLRPGSVLWSLSLKEVYIVELTLHWEDGVEEAFERKHLCYAELAAKALHDS